MKKTFLGVSLMALVVCGFVLIGTVYFGKAQISSMNTIGSQVAGASNSWESKAALPQVFEGCEAAVVNGVIYVMGSNSNLNSLGFAYNPSTDSWTTIAPMPTTRVSFGMVTCGNEIYVIGGFEESLPGGQAQTSSSVNEVYNPSTNTWATAAPMPTGVSEIQPNAVNGEIYVMGGRTGGPSSTVNITQIYNPAKDSWSIGQPMLYPVVSYESAVVDNQIYVIGGQDEYLMNPTGPESVQFNQIYNSANNTWSLGAPIPTGTWAAGVGATTGAVAPKRIYIFGGDVGFAEGSNQNYAYNPSTDSWSTAASVPIACYNPAVVNVNDLLYLIGGNEGFIGLTTNEQYTPLGYNGAPIPTSNTSSPTPTASSTTSPTASGSVSPTSSPSTTNSSPTPNVPEVAYCGVVLVLFVLLALLILAYVNTSITKKKSVRRVA